MWAAEPEREELTELLREHNSNILLEQVTKPLQKSNKSSKTYRENAVVSCNKQIKQGLRDRRKNHLF